MCTRLKSLLLIALVSLALAAPACSPSAATVTPVTPLPTLSLLKPSPTPTTAPPSVTSTYTPLPHPSSTPTPVIPSACPPPADPSAPDRPASFDDYPEVLAAYLSQGANSRDVERLLRDWGAFTDELGAVRSLDMTGDTDPEIVVALTDAAPEPDLRWPPGDVLIFQCQRGAVVPAYQGRLAVDQDAGAVGISLRAVEDVNGTGRADVVYVARTCGANTCSNRLFILEWDGVGFVNRVRDMGEYPDATFTVDDARILVDFGVIGSVGAGYQRTYQEVWEWNGRRFALTEGVVGPPTALVHYIHVGDDALAEAEYGAAIGHYQAALDDTSLPAGLFLETEELGVATIKAYARFKLVVAYAASGDGRGAQSQYDLLIAEHPDGTPGHPYVLLAQAFWSAFLADDSPRSACEAAVALVESDPTLVERLYAGYANPEYEPRDLCRLPG